MIAKSENLGLEFKFKIFTSDKNLWERGFSWFYVETFSSEMR